VIVIDTGEFTLMVILIFVFVVAFAVSAQWADRHWSRLVLAFVSAAIVSIILCSVLIAAIVYSALP
jgi:uncharacterized protein (DUF983 family)